MAERQETSVMASINDILRDAKDQEAKAVEAVRTQALEKERARHQPGADQYAGRVQGPPARRALGPVRHQGRPFARSSFSTSSSEVWRMSLPCTM